MKKTIRFSLLFLVVLLLTSPLVRAQRPPTITEVRSQVVVQEDANLNVKYRLTFLESEPRDKITTMGPFDAGHRILDAHIEHDGQQTPVSLVSKGGGFYTVPFGLSTRAGKEYTVQVHYRVERPLDVTEIDGVEHRVLAWAPIQWNLYIGEQIVTFILPIELPADVTQPEQVTDEVVDKAAIVVDDANVSSFDRWVYYPTPDQATGKNWLSIHISKKNVPPEYHFTPKVYIPGRYFAELPARPIVPAEEFTPTEAPQPAPGRSLLPYLVLFGVLGLFVAGVIVFVIFRLVSPKAAPEEYQAPEIEIETFAQP
ncbi:MAG: DUF2207 domain-containing protein, partial [Chloroflexi bacterium]|nr:DUF2207 domain-containing protein [Chloroflexota bacterium]